MAPERKIKSGAASSKVKKMCGDTGSKDVARLNVYILVSRDRKCNFK